MTATTSLLPMPQLLIDRLLEWHDAYKTVLVNKGANALYSPWLSTKIRDGDLTENIIYNIPNTIPGRQWNKSFVDEFPELVEYFNCLPLKRVDKIILLENLPSIILICGIEIYSVVSLILFIILS